ncbi:MAG: DUF1223 domain-containing protein [Sulfitobacter sp.]
MKIAALALAATTALGLATPIVAQQSPVVVELYTSQGCSSCPAADALLHELSDRDDVIALALHVDYWDYIGWKDPFGNPAHADRQRAYANAGHRRSIYTPEMVVHGQTDIVGAKAMALAKAISEHSQMKPQVALKIIRTGENLNISAQKLGVVKGPMTVHMLRYTPKRVTEIKRGENAGKTIEYANVVEGWQVLQTWDGDAPLTLAAPAPGDKPAVVIIQSQNAGPILAAARLR